MIHSHLPNASGIYRILNTVSGRVYVGSAANVNTRCSRHFWCLRNGKHPSPLLQSTFDKHGESNFQISVLELCDRSLLIEREQYWIDTCEAFGEKGYNLSPVAYSCAGIKRSAETKSRMSASMKGKTKSDSHRQKLSEVNKGKTHSEETKQKMSSSRAGRVFSDETKSKISAANTGRKHTDATKANMSKASKGRPAHNKGVPMSESQRQHMSEVMKGRPAPNKGRAASEEHKQKLREAWVRRKARQFASLGNPSSQ